MLDIGLGEVAVIAVVALLVFGPDRLPKAAADAARTLRHLRQVASSARQELVAAAGLDEGGELSEAVGQLRELDPRRGSDPRHEVSPAQARPATSRQPSAAPTKGDSVAAKVTGSGTAEVQADPDWT